MTFRSIKNLAFYSLFAIWAVFHLPGCSGLTFDKATSPANGYYEDYGGDSDYYLGMEKFGTLEYNPFVFTAKDHLSTFGVDVDAGSYTLGRKKINQGILRLQRNRCVSRNTSITFGRITYRLPPSLFQSPYMQHHHPFEVIASTFSALASGAETVLPIAVSRGISLFWWTYQAL